MDTDLSQLDPELRRNLAITLGAQQPQLAALRAPAGPEMAAPGPITLPGQDRVPNLAISAPTIKAPRGTVQGDQAERARMLGSGAGVDQIYGKVTGSDFGQDHPIAGKALGGLAQGIGKLGDIGLSAVAPALAINLPGTEFHHAAQLHGLNKQIGAEEGEQEKESQGAERQANAAHLQEETEELPGKTASEEALQKATTERTEAENEAGPSLATGYAHAVNQAIKEGRDPATDPVVQHLGDAIQNLQKQTTAPPGTKVIQRNVAGKPHNVLIDERTGADVKDMGETGEKPPVVNVNAGTAALDREVAHFGKPYQATADKANDKFDRINQTIHSVDSGYVGQGLAIPELLTSLVSGQGTGVRITQPELNAITAARGIKGDAESFFNTLAGKGKLTDTDKAQIKDVLGEAKRRLEAKHQIVNDALDKINGSASREQIVAADKEARQKLTQLETFGHYEGETVTIKGKQVTINKIHPDGSFE